MYICLNFIYLNLERTLNGVADAQYYEHNKYIIHCMPDGFCCNLKTVLVTEEREMVYMRVTYTNIYEYVYVHFF